MKRARILVNVDCGAWGVLPAGAVRDVVDLGEESVTVRFFTRKERLLILLQQAINEQTLQLGGIVEPPSNVNGSETVVVALSEVELTDELAG